MTAPEMIGSAKVPPLVTEEALLKKISCASGLLAILAGLAGILGNITGITLLSSVCTGCKTMALSAALIWIFFGAVLVYLSARPAGRTFSLGLRAADRKSVV